MFRKIWGNTDQITKWIQVVALGIAAYWAYTKFQLGEAPSLKPNVAVSGILSWEDAALSGNCYIKFQVSVQNVGKVELNITRVRIRAWRTDIPKSASHSLKDNYFDVDQVLVTGSNEFDQVFNSGNLIKHYLPQNASSQTYTWVVRRASPAIYLFRADVGNEKDFFSDYGRQWADNVCVAEK